MTSKKQSLSQLGYQILFLQEGDIHNFIALQARVLENLPEGKKHFLKPRTEEDLKAHIQSGMPMIGVKHGGQLVAQALLSYPMLDDVVLNIKDYPIANLATCAVVQSLSVDPDHQGVGLGALVIETAVDVAAMRGFGCVHAKVAEENPSKQSFLKSDFIIAAKGKDPERGYQALYLKRYIYHGCTAASQTVAKTLKIA